MDPSVFLTMLANAMAVLAVCKVLSPFKTLDLRYAFPLIGICLVSGAFLSYFAEHSPLPSLRFNWLGKLAAIAFMLTLLAVGVFRRQEIGLTKPEPTKNYRGLFIFCIVYFLLRIVAYAASSKPHLSIDIETTLYQATLPGIHEEILYRGIVLFLLSKLLQDKSVRLGRVSVSMASVLSSVLFALDHAFSFDASFAMHFSLFTFLRTLIDGFLFAQIAEKSKSILPAIAYHNLLNLIGNH